MTNARSARFSEASECISEGRIDDLRRLLEAGLEPELGTDDWTLLSCAIELENEAAVELLLSFGADVNRRTSQGMTPLHHAADVGGDGFGQTGKRSSLAVCEVLLRNGADASLRDDDGQSPAELAREYGWCAAAALLDGADGRPAQSRYVLGPRERPAWFHYPQAYLQLVDQDFVELTPWTMLTAADAIEQTQGLQSRYPTRQRLPFARRQDNDDVACWERSRPREVAIVHDFASQGWEEERRASFGGWYRSAVEDMADWDEPVSRSSALDLGRHRRWLISRLDDPLFGRVLCDLVDAPVSNGREHARLLTERLRRRPLPEAWVREISREDAEAVARIVYERGARSESSRRDARMLAKQFVDALGPSAQFFSTFAYEVGSRATWAATGTSLFGRCFEMGFLAAGAERVGVLWVADDD